VQRKAARNASAALPQENAEKTILAPPANIAIPNIAIPNNKAYNNT